MYLFLWTTTTFFWSQGWSLHTGLTIFYNQSKFFFFTTQSNQHLSWYEHLNVNLYFSDIVWNILVIKWMCVFLLCYVRYTINTNFTIFSQKHSILLLKSVVLECRYKFTSTSYIWCNHLLIKVFMIRRRFKMADLQICWLQDQEII